MKRCVIQFACLAALLLLTLVPGGQATASGAGGFAGSKAGRIVLGYYCEDYPGDNLSYNSLAKHHALIDAVVTFNYLVDGKGNLTGQPLRKGVGLAKKNNVKPLMLIHNLDGYFDPGRAHSVLANVEYRRNLEKNILKEIQNGGFDGVNIDLEAVPPGDRNHYTVFLGELRDMFRPYGYLLTVSIPAKSSDDSQNAWSGAYDYRAIGRLADLVAIMTYDEHWSGGEPGPVASFGWVQHALDYAIQTIPRQKILMGIAAYGYDWSDGGARVLSWAVVNRLTAQYNSARWSDQFCSPYTTYRDSGGSYHEIWFENKYSLALKLDLARAYGVGGVAVWRLGMEDESLWETLQNKLTG
ncbi:MAG: glycoside hydrolase [Firmicutes bacterium]|nr:glycoside hydrolase [Bacillota bacterium]